MSSARRLSLRHKPRAALWVMPALSLVVGISTGSAESAPGAANGSALALLSTVRVAKETPAGYRRELFKHWVDADGDRCNTREEVLISESLGQAQVDPFGCKVLAGDWISPYDNQRIEDPANLDIDHVVPLKEAWDSGARTWSSSRRQSFANDLSDPRSLIAVTASSNRSKGDKDPSNWLPPSREYLCTYLSDWVAIKARWALSMDQSEFGRIRKILTGDCAGTEVAPWGTQRSPGATPGQAGGEGAPNVTDTTAVKGSTSAVAGFKPGQFCTPVGATGTYKGHLYICATSNAAGVPYKDSRARWRRG